jgi:peroxiredoxin
MKLAPPAEAPPVPSTDIAGNPVVIGNGLRRTLLCFFRDAYCPFCNYRIYELTARHAELSALGLNIVAVFSSSPDAVRRFVARHPRPFAVVADTAPATFEAYGIEKSFWRKLKGIVARLPTALKGLRIVGLRGLNTSNLMPADFLVNEHGRIVEAYYGTDAGDRISLERVREFAERGALRQKAIIQHIAATTIAR